MTISFRLTLRQLASLASLRAATPQGVTDRQVTPVITAVQLTVDHLTVTAVATDRYLLAEVTFELGSPCDAPRTTAQLLDTSLVEAYKYAKARKAYAIEVFCDDSGTGAWTVEIDGATMPLVTVAGNYPPIARLLTEAVDDVRAGTRLPLDRIARADKITADHDYGVKFGQFAGFDIASVGSERRASIMLTRPGVRVLIQPLLVTD
jgi:hypothetical protein